MVKLHVSIKELLVLIGSRGFSCLPQSSRQNRPGFGRHDLTQVAYAQPLELAPDAENDADLFRGNVANIRSASRRGDNQSVTLETKEGFPNCPSADREVPRDVLLNNPLARFEAALVDG